MTLPHAILPLLVAPLVLALPLPCPGGHSPPGVVVDHSLPSTRRFIGSPSLAILTNGTYLASHDFFGPGTTHDQTVLFESRDQGAHWSPLSSVDGQFWSSLFVHRGLLYLLGPNRQNGHVVIRRSLDGGRTWTVPRDEETGGSAVRGRSAGRSGAG